MTERTPLYLAGLVVALCIGALLVGKPVLARYRTLGEELGTARAEAAELGKLLAATKDSRLAVAAMSDVWGAPLTAAERPRRASRFYGRLDRLATDAGLHVESLQPRPDTVDSQGLVRQPVTANLTGNLKSLVAFLAQVRASKQLVGIDRLDIRRRDDAAAPLAIQAILVQYGVADRDTRARLAHDAAKKAGASHAAGAATKDGGEARH